MFNCHLFFTFSYDNVTLEVAPGW